MLTIENDQCSREKGRDCGKKKAATKACDRLPLLYFQCVTSVCVCPNTQTHTETCTSDCRGTAVKLSLRRKYLMTRRKKKSEMRAADTGEQAN